MLTHPIPKRDGSMVRLPSQFDPIDYLVRRKYPLLRIAAIPPSISSTSTSARIDRAKIREEAARYRSELEAMPREAVEALAKAERAEEIAQVRLRLIAEENARFFNQQYAAGNFGHWSKAQYWTIDEAVALSLGKAPERVNWSNVKPLVDHSPFAQRYRDIRDLALRCVAWQTLYDPVLPALFLDWTRKNELPFPEELAVLVTARHDNAVNWRLLYEKLKADSERDIADLRTALRAGGSGQTLDEPRPDAKRGSDSGAVRERESLLKLVIAVATKKYRYDPMATRSDAVSRIKRDLEDCGLSLDDATILKYLRQGAELLPPKGKKEL
ncbi:MAG: hypothetical protein KGM42_05020 [Hyphomicrobiales bacterium]|nr:hypothetical protein [Hyphomicrobiales bacterium]